VGETFAGLPYEMGVDLADELKPLVPADVSMAAWALRWCLDFDAVSTVIPGARNPEQVLGNVSATSLPPLGAAAHGKLATFYARSVAEHIRGPY